jgi:hypothetical protein
VALLCLAAACGGSDQLSPSTQGEVGTGDSLAPTPPDSTLTPLPTDSTPVDTAVVPETALTGTGIPFGLVSIRGANMTALYRATQLGLAPPYLMDELKIIKAKGGRLMLKMGGKSDGDVQNADGTFSVTKWKALIDRYKDMNFDSYITDGTIIGHFLVDEPENTHKWGGKEIPPATLEAMAQYSKNYWPGLITFARTPPSWLAKSSMTYTYLDAGWVQYAVWRGNPATWVAAEAAAAKSKGLGMMTGLNVLDGGDGSSGIRGWLSNKWSMTATEIRNYGTAMLGASLGCGFLSWTYLYQGATYFARTDVNSAMVDLSTKAKAHTPTSCRQ